MGITITSKGDWSKTTQALKKMRDQDIIIESLQRYAEQGLAALEEATPSDTGATRSSWGYKIEQTRPYVWSISYYNSNIVNGFSVIIGLQYGHATRQGGWVEGRDIINPAIQPIFDSIAEDAWKTITNK